MAGQETDEASKEQLRERLRATRDLVPETWRGIMSTAAARHALTRLKEQHVVAVYSAIRSELDPGSLVEALRGLGATIVYPRINGTAPILDFYQVDDAEHLRAGLFGILEPTDDATPVNLTDIDAFIVPALSFDPHGNRLGWGKGHYDQTLAQNPRALRVGLCFQEQIENSLPCEPTDQSMDWVVTDATIYQGQKRPALDGKGSDGPKEQT